MTGNETHCGEWNRFTEGINSANMMANGNDDDCGCLDCDDFLGMRQQQEFGDSVIVACPCDYFGSSENAVEKAWEVLGALGVWQT